MMPTTPNGTRTWRSSSPLGSVEPRTTSPTGSGSAASCAQAVGHRRRPGPRSSAQPVDHAPRACRRVRPARTSSALAARISAVRADQRVGHRAAARASLTRRVAAASSAAARARRRPDLERPLRRARPRRVRTDLSARATGHSSDEVVAVDDLAFVRRPSAAASSRVERPSSAGQLRRVVVDQPAGDRRARSASTRSTGSPAAKSPVDRGDAGRQQRLAPGHHGLRPRPASRCSRPRGGGGVREPEQPGRRAAAGRGGRACRPRSPASAGAASGGGGRARTGMPAPVAIRAASTLVTMPPVPTPAPPARPMRDAGQVVRRRAPRRSGARRAGAGRRRRAVDVGEQHQQVGVDQVRRPARPAGRCRRTGSRRWRPCRSR